jgi:hypothetical protein
MRASMPRLKPSIAADTNHIHCATVVLSMVFQVPCAGSECPRGVLSRHRTQWKGARQEREPAAGDTQGAVAAALGSVAVVGFSLCTIHAGSNNCMLHALRRVPLFEVVSNSFGIRPEKLMPAGGAPSANL